MLDFYEKYITKIAKGSLSNYFRTKQNCGTIFSVLLIIAILFLVYYIGLTINITPSIKKGLYIKSSGEIKRGDIVSVCLKAPYQKIALERHYISKGRKCFGADPLVKEVLAVPGDTVILAAEYVEVNAHRHILPIHSTDSAGRMLTAYPRGMYARTCGYWLVGNNSEKSWDSRYFGPVKKEQIIAKLKPLLVW